VSELAVGAASVRCLFERPGSPTAVMVFAHGAGAGMQHASIAAIAAALIQRGIAVLRFNFPFIEAGRKRVDPRPVATATIAAAVARAKRLCPDLPLFVGGHSFGGRMASHALLDHELGAIRGLVFCSFPLHPAGRPATSRAAHLAGIALPMLFVSGSRDALAEPGLLRGVVDGLERAELYWLDTADHGYRVQKRLRQRSDSVFDELGDVVAAFVSRVC
jgi:uncharacterized protein